MERTAVANMIAYALVHCNPPEVLFAEDGDTLSELLARQIISQTPSSRVDAELLSQLRASLMKRQWADALSLWIEVTGIAVDVYDFENVCTAELLKRNSYRRSLQNSPLFKD